MRLKRLKQIFENWKLSAIFAVLNTKGVPWAQTVNAAPLDLDYVGNFSGRKIVSNLVQSLLSDDEDATLTPADLSMLCDIILALYGTKWAKLWETMAFDYNPIENYSMVETMTNDETVTEYGKTRTRTDNLQHAKTGTETETPNTRTSEDKSVYGFNSEEAVPTDEREIANTGTNQITYNTQDADTGTQTEADTGTQTDVHTGTQIDADTGSDTSTRNYRLTRAGNIGVTTSQQMIESERNLWRLWDFFRGVVYPDIDRVLTIEIY